ncbi:MAG: ATP-binding protein [Myxococcota bacterium]|nr:ATP-binding protein [Myxococcota bacterium]
MTLFRCALLLLAVVAALGTTGESQAIAWVIAAATATSLVQSVLFHRRLSQLIHPEWDDGSQEPNSTDRFDRLSRSIQTIRGKLKRRVERLAAERDRLGVLLEGMAEGVISLDALGKINASNHAGRALFETNGDGSGLSLIEVLRVPELHETAQRALRGQAGETEFESTDGRNLLARIHPLKQGGAVVVILDLTEVRRLERVRKDFVANVEHELRTPVAVIQSSSEVLVTHGSLSGKALELAEAIHRHAERLGLLITSLLELSRLESGKHEIELVPTNLHAVIERSLLLCRDQIDAKGVMLRNTCDPSLNIVSDDQALEQILVNLIDNALKYGGQSIWIGTQSRGQNIELSIEDDGQGIEARHHARLFERFYRVDGGRHRKRGGSGLGLAIVKHLCQAMKGNIRYEERQPHGSRFVLALKPAKQEEKSSVLGP